MVPSSGLLRLIRVAFFALTAVGLAAAAHVAAGGDLPMRVALVAVPVVMLAINGLAGRQRRVRSLLPAMGLAELLLHLAFMSGAGASSCHAVRGGSAGQAGRVVSAGLGWGAGQPAGSPVKIIGHSHIALHGQVSVHCDPMAAHTAVAGTHMVMAGAGSGPGVMLAAHITATVLTTLVLARGESAVWALASCRAFTVLPESPVLWQPVRPGPLTLGRREIIPPRLHVHRRPIQRRGPPHVVRPA